jgi:hypothetical protein
MLFFFPSIRRHTLVETRLPILPATFPFALAHKESDCALPRGLLLLGGLL